MKAVGWPARPRKSFLAEANSSTSFWHYRGDLGPKIQSFVIGKEDRSIDRESSGGRGGGRRDCTHALSHSLHIERVAGNEA